MAQTAVTEEQIEEIARTIGEQPGVVQVWLFGSHATGTAGPDSDVDLLVVYEEEPSDRLETMFRLGELFRPRPCAMDILVTNKERFERWRGVVGTLANMASQHGQVLYERG